MLRNKSRPSARAAILTPEPYFQLICLFVHVFLCLFGAFGCVHVQLWEHINRPKTGIACLPQFFLNLRFLSHGSLTKPRVRHFV